jgi:hypothetical protein
MELFKELNYSKYLKDHPFHLNLEVKLEEYGDLTEKIVRDKNFLVNPKNKTPISVELDDLIRLHYLATTRKVSTILEFGSGKSTVVLDHALEINKLKHIDFYTKNLRKSNLFECHSIDTNADWIEKTKLNNSFKNVTFHLSACRTTTFNDRICTMYDNLPNISPDLIYLDGPDQYSPIGDVRGISTRNPDRIPMSADILGFEHFLLPGTLIVIDGRTANARFLKTNLQRNWTYYYFEDFDQHFFELEENPLGNNNKKQIEYCLGLNWE